ncbi:MULTISPECIES: amidohydrolase [unclassified Tenacibaculum]|uniref:amidohydrolase n=1 Tax=unclassified Tenacibaculum TaxID=2635139 RepID=UPI001F332C87|nr:MULTISPECIES: amidohydrolase family protein [unclassified Tenacibaculum]MCF2873473.1 amidohydrolase [Tenacibaculum sp. Cn5-1]MCF2933629.1 amidohydrolase [Tenacibaculum sp. Cn5-34]MCG7509789.1 amidohydrolase [Tenacibaculum sp. Cn5-46]
MKKILFPLVLTGILFSCKKQEKADVIVINANTYTVNTNFDKAESFAIRDGKFIAVGSNKEIQEKYATLQTIDANNKPVYPGFIDAHCHFYGLGLQQQKVNLVGTKSYSEVLQKLVKFQKEKNTSFITGRGWDQNDWEIKEFPTKEKLDHLFPKIPVAIRRIDGHAMLVNQAAIDLAGITIDTKVEGGEFLQKDGKLTGVLIDNAMNFIKVPQPSKREQIQALKDAQKICFDLGLTTVDDAGLDKQVIELIDSLQQTGDLKMRIYAMISNNKENLDYYLNKGVVKTDRLNVRSVKVYSDGALGSRGATLKDEYSDKKGHFGALVNSYNDLQDLAKRIAASEYQMNTHAIGDSANYVMLKTYDNVLKNKQDRRWRIEHAQIVDLKDFHFFKNVLPSIQPTHATSDMYWAEDRVGAERIKGAYAYNDLLKEYGKVALGTDFPIEHVSPLYTYYAATIRKDLKGYPEKGYQMNNALTRKDALKGMTIWNAYANFEEKEKGSIEVGKVADFIILENDIMTVDGSKIPNTKVIATYVNGEKVN